LIITFHYVDGMRQSQDNSYGEAHISLIDLLGSPVVKAGRSHPKLLLL
jgi:hypothetical protein